MRSSRSLLATALTAALVLGGCAHAPRHAGGEEPRERDHEAPAPPPRRAELPPEPVPAEPPPGGAPARLDPSEQITPEELATLPDPVPRGSAAQEPAPNAPEPSSGTLPPGSGSRPSGGDSAAPAPSEGLWSVQIHASESRAEAERLGRAAARRLGAELFIQREGSLYKVRLGAFATEAEAQGLRDRAIRAGYPGAFRTRFRP
jgi:cell division septation protein DedD